MSASYHEQRSARGHYIAALWIAGLPSVFAALLGLFGALFAVLHLAGAAGAESAAAAGMASPGARLLASLAMLAVGAPGALALLWGLMGRPQALPILSVVSLILCAGFAALAYSALLSAHADLRLMAALCMGAALAELYAFLASRNWLVRETAQRSLSSKLS